MGSGEFRDGRGVKAQHVIPCGFWARRKVVRERMKPAQGAGAGPRGFAFSLEVPWSDVCFTRMTVRQ